jgi:hypothetical protein
VHIVSEAKQDDEVCNTGKDGASFKANICACRFGDDALLVCVGLVLDFTPGAWDDHEEV